MVGLKSQAGFTLVEMSITVAIIGILAAIAVPTFINVLPRVRLNNNTTTLANEVSLSRVRAIAKSTRFRIAFDPAADTYDLQRENAGAWVTMAKNKISGSDLVGVTNLLAANALVADWNGTLSVPFGARGLITLRTPEGSYQKRVVVEASGRVQVERSFDGGASWQGD